MHPKGPNTSEDMEGHHHDYMYEINKWGVRQTVGLTSTEGISLTPKVEEGIAPTGIYGITVLRTKGGIGWGKEKRREKIQVSTYQEGRREKGKEEENIREKGKEGEKEVKERYRIVLHEVLANDSAGLQDMARVFIYLVREDQRVRFVLRQHPPEVRERIDIFREVLGNVTGAIVNVDEFKVHENQDGSVDKTKTDLYLHFVNQRDNSIMEVMDVLRLVDQEIERLDPLFKDFNVLDTQPAEAQDLKNDAESLMLMWLVGTTVFLGLMLILLISICLSQKYKYQRQLKAATVAAFGSNECDMNHVTGRVPNTNMHSVEGSNPIWMQAYENEWYKEADSMSQTSERDSLDENAVSNDDLRPTSKNAKPFFVGPPHTYTDSSCNRSNMLPEAEGVKEQNDLNRSVGGVYHQNLYLHLDKLSNPLIAKKLETTEL
uniref:Cadherin-23 n=1 Tax=Timema shepardi TaxID=629360 RepID=A0A7R9ATD0_TIMSH|nr:unnamed protein product [Timema shepardi]